MSTYTGSPKDRSRIQGWDSCPDGYVHPCDNQMRESIDQALVQLKKDCKKPLKRSGAGGSTFTIWRKELEVTTKKPLILTKATTRKVG